LIDSKQLWRGKGLTLYDDVVVKHPTLGMVFDDYEKYSTNLSIIASSSLDVADILWCEHKIFYEDIQSEWAFFIQKSLANYSLKEIYVLQDGVAYSVGREMPLINSMYAEALNYFIGTTGEWMVSEKKVGEIEQISLYNLPYVDDKLIIEENAVRFTEQSYHNIVEYLRAINMLSSDYKFLNGGTKKARKYMLDKYYMYQRKAKDTSTVDIESIVSALITLRIFEYDKIWDVPIYVIYNCYLRQMKITEYKNTMQALYSGCIDTKKNPVDFDKINWASIIKLK